MMRASRWLLFLLTALTAAHSQVVVFYEDSFPSADSVAIPRKTLSEALPDATFADSSSLTASLANAKLLVLPYGSAFPEAAWPGIYSYLQRGGNLLATGRPFTRAAFLENGKWQLRDYTVRFSRQLLINDYSQIAIEGGTHAVSNPEITLDVPSVLPARAFSPIIRLSTKDVYPTEGSAGSIDARLDSIQWIDGGGDHLAAPVIAVDHLRSTFASGRWVFVGAELAPTFVEQSGAVKLISGLAVYALRGAEEFYARPVQATFLPGEPVQLTLVAHANDVSPNAEATFILTGEQPIVAPVHSTPLSHADVDLAPLTTPGLYRVETRFTDGGKVLRIDHSAFWVRDDKLLESGARLTASDDFFQLDGKPAAIVGTTYMSSDVQRLFLQLPNVAVWDHDMGQIRASGMNLIRTGLWSGWRDATNEDGTAKEVFLRNLEAFLLTARRHNLQVQFTFFSFLPESFGGANPYLDPVAIEHQQNFLRSVVQRFKDVPYLSYDLINEPSISQYTWRTRPNGDKVESDAWNAWLRHKYGDRSALAEAWNMPAIGDIVPLPTAEEFALRGAYFGNNGLKVHDYYLFAQSIFAEWARKMSGTVHEAASTQLVTVGQDDGGYQERLNPAFFSEAIDFTTNHTWWLNDDLLWCSLVAKQAGKPMLIQETGLQRQLTPRETMRLTADAEAALLERKIALSFAGGAGAVEWLWNVNAYMTSDNEVTIGAVRADGTLKPDSGVLRGFARFAKDASPYLSDIEQPQVAIVTSQALQYSPWNSLANLAQQRAVRAVFYNARIAAYMLPENRLDQLGRPKLVVLPSPQALSEPAWQALMQYVREGGNLLITGPVERDEHWQDVARVSRVGVTAKLAPLNSHVGQLMIDSQTVSLQFTESAQENLEKLVFHNDSSVQEIKLGKGSITWIAYPIELNEDVAAIGKVYSFAAKQAGIGTMVPVSSAPDGVLIYAQPMRDAVLYIFESETDRPATISITDPVTHAKFRFALGAQRAALAVVQRADGKIVARYGF